MYENLNDSPETEEKKIRYLNERKTKNTKELLDKPTKFKKLDCNRCGAPKWSRRHECPAKRKKSAKCEKIGHYAKCCRTNTRDNHVQDNVVSSAEEDDCIFAVTGGNFTGYYRFMKEFYGLAVIPTIFQETKYQTLENKHPAWLDDIIVVTKGSK